MKKKGGQPTAHGKNIPGLAAREMNSIEVSPECADNLELKTNKKSNKTVSSPSTKSRK